ncbi:MAG: hypothetical protein MJZ34_05095 [Paludibacteraceae bacterium]|nr:hypothetical protein [Paludibacteraceae bacterium]
MERYEIIEKLKEFYKDKEHAKYVDVQSLAQYIIENNMDIEEILEDIH